MSYHSNLCIENPRLMAKFRNPWQTVQPKAKPYSYRAQATHNCPDCGTHTETMYAWNGNQPLRCAECVKNHKPNS
jgi:hypothetical protein